ncbi:alpha/beta hydrolase [Bacillus sp. REN10]|uniref:alpha/beta fold hydrolase n=1 Tax=Bacillus sp. REN10 TaxID=2782541 RepID=UPI00193C0B43|nr:alpha/beta hydrolase [Bacillus sp. REN10]
MPYAEIKNRRVFYETAGEGPAVLFVHPPGMSQYVFCKQYLLKGKMKLILMDLNGHGQSESSFIGDMNSFLEDISAVQSAIEEEQIFLFGYSAGGTLVQRYALTYPDKVKGVILASGYPKVDAFLFQAQHQTGIQLTDKAPLLLAKLISNSHFNRQEDKREMYEAMRKVDRHVWKRFYQLSLHSDITSQLASWQLPILSLYGGRSPVVNKYSRYYETLPNSQVIFIKNGTHQLPSKFSAEVNPLLAEFIEKWR